MWDFLKKKKPEPFLTRRDTYVRQTVATQATAPKKDSTKAVVVTTLVLSVVIGAVTVYYTNVEPDVKPVVVEKMKTRPAPSASDTSSETPPSQPGGVAVAPKEADKTDEDEAHVEIIPLDLSGTAEALSKSTKGDTKKADSENERESVSTKSIEEPSRPAVVQNKSVEPKIKPLATTSKAVISQPKNVDVDKTSKAAKDQPSQSATSLPEKKGISLGKSEGTSIPLTGESAQYYLLERSGSSREPILLIKKQSTMGTQYSKRVFNCTDKTSAYLGVGETMDDMLASKSDAGMSEIKPGSATWLLMKYACRQ